MLSSEEIDDVRGGVDIGVGLTAALVARLRAFRNKARCRIRGMVEGILTRDRAAQEAKVVVISTFSARRGGCKSIEREGNSVALGLKGVFLALSLA